MKLREDRESRASALVSPAILPVKTPPIPFSRLQPRVLTTKRHALEINRIEPPIPVPATSPSPGTTAVKATRPDPSADRETPSRPRRPARLPNPAILLLLLVLAAVAVAAGSLIAWRRAAERAAVAAWCLQFQTALDEQRLEAAQALLAPPALPPALPPGEADYQAARLARARNRPQDAILAMGRALDVGFPRDRLETLRAVLRAEAGEFRIVEPLLRAALDRTPPDELLPHAAEALARGLVAEFRFREALPVIERWIEARPRDPRPLWLRADVEARLDNNADKRVRDYREALRLDPDFQRARLDLAEQLRIVGRDEEALVEYRTYLRALPDDPLAKSGAGRAALNLGRFDEARTLLDQALALDPRDVDALVARATLDLRQNRPEQAARTLADAVAADPHNQPARYQYAIALRRLGRRAEADEQLAASARLKDELRDWNRIRLKLLAAPRDNDARVEAARWLLAHGREDEGLDWAELALKDDPNHQDAHRLLAEHYRAKGDPGRANHHRFQLREPDPEP